MKYIDAELLRKEIKRLKDEYTDIAIDSQKGWVNANSVIDDLEQLQSQIDSLQQEQSEPIKGKFVFPKFLYARTVDNKTIDVSYALQSMDAVEYIRNDSLQQEMPDKEAILQICKLHKAWSIIAPWENIEDFVTTNWNSKNIV